MYQQLSRFKQSKAHLVREIYHKVQYKSLLHKKNSFKYLKF